MDYTNNLHLAKFAEGDTVKQLMTGLAANADALDAMPIPVTTGSNANGAYINFANGYTLMWRSWDTGNNYPCKNRIEGNSSTATPAFYTSDIITIKFPQTVVDTNTVAQVTVCANAWTDIVFYPTSQDTTCIKGRFSCRSDDTLANTSKTITLIAIGKWK